VPRIKLDPTGADARSKTDEGPAGEVLRKKLRAGNGVTSSGPANHVLFYRLLVANSMKAIKTGKAKKKSGLAHPAQPPGFITILCRVRVLGLGTAHTVSEHSWKKPC